MEQVGTVMAACLRIWHVDNDDDDDEEEEADEGGPDLDADWRVPV